MRFKAMFPTFSYTGLRLTIRASLNLVSIVLLGMLDILVPAGPAFGEQTPAEELSVADSQGAVGRYFERGEGPDLAEEGTATQELLARNESLGQDATGLDKAAGPFLFGLASNGIVSLNQSTGAVNFCVGYTHLNTGVPYGKCKKLGAISAVGLVGNARIDVTSNVHAFVTNTMTGLVLECYLGHNTSTGVPSGSCISQQIQP